MPETGPPPRIINRHSSFREIDTTSTVIYDGDIDFSVPTPTGTEHPLVDGLAIKAGRVRAWIVKTTVDCPLTAVFISEDESSVQPGTPEGAPEFKDSKYIWKFKWEELTALGCNGVLRFAELRKDDTVGSAVNYSVSVLDDLANDPCLRTDAVGLAPRADDDEMA